MKKIYALFVALAVSASIAHADSTLFGGQPRMTFEYEQEKNTAEYGNTPNTAVSVFPGIQWKETDPNRPLGFITRAEFMIEGNQDHMKWGTQTVGGNTTETKYGIRLRTDGSFDKTWGYFVRGLVGQSFNNERNFSYWYLEPGLKTKLNDTWSWTTSYRVVRAIDRSAKDADRNKLRIGPNVDFDKNNGMEFRYVYVTDPNNSNQHRANAYLMEYIHKF